MSEREGGKRSVEVWVARPVAAAQVAGLLDEAEEERLGRFRFDRDRRSYASAHALTRRLLSSVTGNRTRPADWRFQIAEFGKPFVDPASGPAQPFNLSHTRGLVAAAASSEGVEVGVDVEAIGTRDLAEELRERVLSPDEAAALDALPTGEQAQRFFSIWALKESYIKARGLGLRLPLKEISFAFHGNAVTLEAVPGEPLGRWHVDLRLLDDPAPHALGVTVEALETEALDVRLRTVALSEDASS